MELSGLSKSDVIRYLIDVGTHNVIIKDGQGIAAALFRIESLLSEHDLDCCRAEVTDACNMLASELRQFLEDSVDKGGEK